MATEQQLNQAKLELEQLREQVLSRDKSVIENNDVAPSGPLGVSRQLLQGLTFGFSDEIGAAGAAAFKSLTGDDGFKDVFDDTLFTLKRQREAFNRKHPLLSFASEVTGGAAQGGGLLRLASRAPAIRNAPSLVRVGAVGGAEGAAFGAGTADPGNRLSGGLQGAAIGSVLGPAAAVGLSTAGQVLRPSMRKLGETLAQTPRDRAIRLVRSALDADDITPDEGLALLRNMGDQSTLADLGENLTGLARTSASQPGRGSNIARRFLDERQFGQQVRLRQAARRATASDTFDEGVISVINNADTAAAPLYRQAFEQTVDVTDVLGSLLERPAMKSAKTKAASILRNEGFDPSINNDLTDVRYLDAVKRALDDKIGVAQRTGKRNEVRVLSDLKNSFVAEIDNQVPIYAQAREVFAGEAAMRDAADLGQSLLNRNTRVGDVRDAVTQMSDSELQALRHGLLTGFAEDLSNTQVTRNVAKRLAETPKIREVLRLAFPDQDAVENFIRRAQAESTFSQTRNTVLGGSPTARIQAGQRQAAQASGVPSMLFEGATGGMGTAVRVIRDAIFRQDMSPDVAEQIARILFDPTVIPNRLRPNPVVSAFNIPQLQPSVFSGVAGGAAGSQVDALGGISDIVGGGIFGQ